MPVQKRIVSRVVDRLARKLAGFDTDKLIRFTKILSEEAEQISDELEYDDQTMNAEIIAARLEGFAKRLKYELRTQGPDLSPYEFPIYNVSYDAKKPYPKPINYMYDKHYNQAYSNFIKQTKDSSNISGKKYQPNQIYNKNSLSYYTYNPQQYTLDPTIMYYQEPMMKVDMNPINYHLVDSSTGYDTVPYLTNGNVLINSKHQNHENPQKSHPVENKKKETVTTKRIYAAKDTVIGSETVEDLLEIADIDKSEPSKSNKKTDRIIIIDRPDAQSSKKKQSKQKKETLVNTSETKKAATTINVPVATVPPTNYVLPQSTYANYQQMFYQQPTTFMSLPTSAYAATASYNMQTTSYYPYAYIAY